MQLLQVAQGQKGFLQERQLQVQNLSELRPIEVFQMRLDNSKIYDVQLRDGLEQTFNELIGWMQELDKE
jgi:hypothetical protein